MVASPIAIGRQPEAKGSSVPAWPQRLAENSRLMMLTAWVEVANTAVAEIKSETTVCIVNAGDQVQKHPAVTVLEAASKRIEALVVMTDRFVDPDPTGNGGTDAPEPPKFTVVS